MDLKSLIYILFILSLKCVANNNNDSTYIQYHKWVNNAERCYFLSHNVDSAFIYYDKAFSKYNYVFVKDLLNAAQISVFEHKKNYKQYLLRAFKYGFQFKHFKYFPLFESIAKRLATEEFFVKQARLNRQKYIKNVNFEYLLKIYRLGINDQIEKCKFDKHYSEFSINTIKYIEYWISYYGFPSSKIIGIDDKQIFSEIGMPQFDLDSLKYKFSNKLNYYSLDEKVMSNNTVMILLIHNECSFVKLKDKLHTSMLKGEIHPREIGLLYDNMYRFDVHKCELIIDKGVFLLNLFCDYNKFKIDTSKVNKLRSEWFVVEMNVDKAKKEFEKKYGFRLFYGFWNCM